ncbi:MAG: right-handed parallel beta-helix repeat-containing protein, partial [Clostridiales bacterium]|nr:right-handed parallel beta-helix repeat-containing protein [Clostridiales bacterium]
MNRGLNLKRFLALGLAVLLLCVMWTVPASAAGTTWNVTSGLDDGAGTLRDILENKAQDGDTVVFAAGVTTVTLTSEGLYFEQADLTIDGGAAGVLIRRMGAEDFRLMEGWIGDGTTRIKNLTFQNGHAGGDGGGLRIHQYNGNIEITGCAFRNNYANFDGGGLSVDGPDEENSTIIKDCTFIDNTCGRDGWWRDNGGGLFARGGVTLENCHFENNTVFGLNKGGGAYLNNESAVPLPKVKNCTFKGNNGGTGGGGLYAAGSVFVDGCTFEDNVAAGAKGGGLYVGMANNYTYNYRISITNSTFLRNVGSAYGGGLYAEYNTVDSFVLRKCVFEQNSSFFGGGGAWVVAGARPILIEDCAFTKNSSDSNYGNGAGLLVCGYFKMARCNFTENGPGEKGGGLYLEPSAPFEGFNEVTDYSFTRNDASYGGGVYMSHGAVQFKRCRFTGNTAETGGGLYAAGINASGEIPLVNCVFSGNAAAVWGGAVYSGSDTSLNACVLVGNSAPKGAAVYAQPWNAGDPVTAILANSTLQGNKGGTEAVLADKIALLHCTAVNNTGAAARADSVTALNAIV